MRRLCLVVAVLFLCFEGSFAHVGSGTEFITNQIHAQLDAFEAVMERHLGSQFKDTMQQQANNLKKMLSGNPKTEGESLFLGFAANAKTLQETIGKWVSEHQHLFQECYSSGALATEVANTMFSSEQKLLAQPKAQELKGYLEKVPFVHAVLEQLEGRPDLKLWIIDKAKETTFGSSIINKYNQWIHSKETKAEVKGDTKDTQVLLDLGGSILEKADSLNSFATSLTNFGSISNGDSIMQPISSVTGSISGGNGPESLNSVFESGSNSLETGQGMIMPSSQSSIAQQDNAMSLSNTLSYYSIIIPESASGAVNSESIFGALASSPSSLLEVESFQSPSSDPASSSAGGSSQGGSSGPDSQMSLSNSGLGGSGGGSGSSLISINSMQSSSGSMGAGGDDGGAYNKQPSGGGGGGPMQKAGGAAGCCAGLSLLIILLGIGAGAEYYIKNMHKYNAEEFEKHFEQSLSAQIEQFTEYLKEHPDRIQKLETSMRDAEENGGDPSDGDEGAPPAPPDHLLSLPLDYKKIIDSIPHSEADSTASSEESEDKKKKPDAMLEGIEDETDKPAKKKKSHPTLVMGGGKDGDPLGRVLMLFYMAYNAIPAMVSKHFGFYVTLLLIAIMASAAGGASSAGGGGPGSGSS